MRRLRILFYWLFYNKNNVGLLELCRFLIKPTVTNVAKKYIRSIQQIGQFYEVTFNNFDKKLYWPKEFVVEGINQVTAETFDIDDWHYYQHPFTSITDGEILLDIGTAEGLFPLTVVDKCSKVFLIEPSLHFVKSLQRTFEKHLDKVTIFQTAVGSRDGFTGFDQNSLAGQITSNESTDQITIRTIDNLIDDNQRVTYLKADIEGFELEMLKGAEQTIRRNKPKIAITTYHKENDSDEIIALVKSFVPEYNYIVKGIHGEEPKPVMVHFYIKA